MVYCCVPYCKSRAGKTPGVSFHQFPVDQELCSKWQRNISRQNLVINDKSPSTVVCSRHFRQIDYAPDCRIRKLLPGALPTVFEDYPAYLAPSAKKPRKEPVVRQSLPPRKPTKRKAEPEELPADLDAPESFDKPSANVSTQTTNNDAQRSSRYLSMVGRLRSQVAYHRSQSQKSLSLLRAEQKASEAYRANRHLAALEEIVADAERGEKKAVFLLHQIGRYGKKHDSYPEEFIRECVIWRFISPKGYDYARTSGLLTLPAKCTLQRYMGPSPTTSGMSAAMKERLVSEASMLSSKQHMASLIIDEASIRPKCIYDRKADAVFGLKDKPGGDTPSSSKEVLANRVLCFVLQGLSSKYKIPCSYYFTKQLSGRDLFTWTKEVIAAVELCGFVVTRIVTDNYSANVTLFKHLGSGSLQTVVRHPHDDSRIILLSFDPCHVLKNVRNQFLERQLTDGSGVISGTFVQELYEHQKNMTIKLARNLTRKHVYPTNLEKMNVLCAVQIFSPQVCAALEHLEENSRNDPALSAFRRASSTVHFMRTMKDWFDMHDTSFGGTGQKAPIADVDDGRLLWLENDFTCYVKKVQASSVASGNGAFTGETFQALLFTTKSTVETTRYLLTQGINYVLTRKLNSDPIEAVFGRVRYMCGGNDMLDARAVTAALDQIVKSKFARPPEVVTCDTDVDKLVSSLSVTFSDDLKELRECTSAPPLSVTCSGLAYVGGYIAKLITDFGCESCAMLLTTSDKDQPLYALLRGQDRSGLAYPRPEFLALLNGIVTFFEKIAKHLPRTHVLEVLQLLVEPHLEDVPLLNCPESVANSHGRRSASLIADKFFRILLVNHSTRVTDDNEKHMNYTHKPSRKHFRL